MKKLIAHPIGLAVVTVIVIGGLSFVLKESSTPRTKSGGEPVFVYCAAGMKPVVDRVAKDYEKELGGRIEIQYGGSGTLLSNIEVSKRGDLYLAADASYVEIALKKGLLAETIPLAELRAVIAVSRGNPKAIHNVQDLLRPELRVALANPDAASIGRTCKQVLEAAGLWEKTQQHVTARGVFKPTVNEVANDVKLGTVDAGIVWDAVAKQYPELETAPLPEFANLPQQVSVGVLRCSQQPTEALRFARYLAARDRGAKVFAALGYAAIEGDLWAVQPEIVLFSGGVNRRAIEDTLKDFQAREGCRVNTVYNGCGILVGQMKAGAKNDAYLACDSSYLSPVDAMFTNGQVISETDIVLLTRKGNPHGIHTLQDLAKPGIRVAVTHPRYSTLGALTEALFKQVGIYDAVMKNVTYSDAPTADYIVTRIQTGREDVGVVYRVNTSGVRDELDVVPVEHPNAIARQPIAINKTTQYRQLVGRLIDAIKSSESRTRYEKVGFRWKVGSEKSGGPAAPRQ